MRLIWDLREGLQEVGDDHVLPLPNGSEDTVNIGRRVKEGWGLLYCVTEPNEVTSLLPPLGLLTRKEVFRYSTLTLTCSPAASSSSNLNCSSSRIVRLYWGVLPFRWVGRVLTTASILPEAPLYLEMEGLRTSSYSRRRFWKALRTSWGMRSLGSSITCWENGLVLEGVWGVAGGAQLVTVLSTGCIERIWHTFPPDVSRTGAAVVLVSRTERFTARMSGGRG